MILSAAINVIEVEALKLFGDGAAATGSDDPSVKLPDRGDFGRRSCEEGFIGNVDFVARDALFVDFKTLLASDCENRFTRDAFKGAGQVRV